VESPLSFTTFHSVIWSNAKTHLLASPFRRKKIITFKCFLKYRYPGHLATVSKYRLLLKYQLFVKRVIYEHETWPSHVHHVKNYSDLLIFNQYVNCSNLFTIILIFNNQQICRSQTRKLKFSNPYIFATLYKP